MSTQVSIQSLLAAQGQETSLVVTVAAGTTLDIVDNSAVMQAGVTIRLERDARLHYVGSFSIDHGVLERLLSIESLGSGAHAEVSMSCHARGTSSFSLATVQRHEASHTSSAVRIVGVGENNSRVSVTSTIYIAPQLCGVVARQVHKQLLLDVGSRAISIPALDILSDDVSCSHGSAISYLDPTQLFYLNARGYDPAEAKKALVNAFLR